jgi:hypothetical protein
VLSASRSFLMRTCTVIEHGARCPAKHYARGGCRKHYDRVRRHGNRSFASKPQRPNKYPLGQMPKVCTRQGCGKPTLSRGLCQAHYLWEYDWGEHGPPQRYETCPLCRQRRYLIYVGNGMCFRCVEKTKRRRNLRHPNGFWDRARCLQAGLLWYKLTGHLPSPVDWRTARGDRAARAPTPLPRLSASPARTA